jgi:hypothetical protein
MYLLIFPFLFAAHLAQAWTLPKSYCLELPNVNNDGNGVIYGTLNWTDATHTAVRFNVTEGIIKGKSFQGPYDSATLTAQLENSGDWLFGTRTVANGTPWVLDMTDSDLSDIAIYSYDDLANPYFEGTQGRCTIDFEANYCAIVNNTQYDFAFDAEIGGMPPTVTGTYTSYPGGAATSFTATVSQGGLKLTWTTGPSQSFNLDFSLYGMAGSFKPSGTSYPVNGMRDPVGTSGCANIKVNGNTPARIYYGTPTIEGDSIYVGTSSGSNHRRHNNNYFARINVDTMLTTWIYYLGNEEVRGSAVIDETGDIYFVTESGRTLDMTIPVPQGSHSASTLFLYKISNPGSGTPTFKWKRPIGSAGSVPSVGTFSPAVREDGLVYVGGDKIYGFLSNGTAISGFPYTSSACTTGFSVKSSPFLYVSTTGTDLVIFHSSCGIHALNSNNGSEVWSFIPSYGSSTPFEHASSPQLARVSGTIYGIYSALYQDLYCFNPEDGMACSSWPSTGGGEPQACSISGLSDTFYRSSPIIDSAGNIYIGTKDNTGASNGIYKIPANCSTGTYEWKYDILADVYPTGVLTSGGHYIVGNETWSSPGGVTLQAYDTSTGAVAQSFFLNGDVSWNSQRIYTDASGNEYLIGALMDGTDFLPGLIYSIKINDGYDTSALNNTFRGENSNVGR